MDEPAVVVGRITKSHGLKGEVSVEVRSDNPDRFEAGASLFLESGRELTVARSHQHGTRLLLTFDGVADRTAADALRDQLLTVPQSWLPVLSDGEYWPYQLEGCTIITEAGVMLGVVSSVIPNPANDLWVAVDEAGAETLIPALSDVIVDVDIEAKSIVVRDIPGLTTPEKPGGS